GGRPHRRGPDAPTQPRARGARRRRRLVRPPAGCVGAHVRRRRRPAQRAEGGAMTDSAPHDSTAIRIECTFRAPAQAVFAAWTSAEMLRRWYPPGADWDTPVAEVDLRVGGRLRLVMRSPTGDEFGGGGEYLEITPPTRLVFTWTWDRAGLGGATQLVEVELTDHPDAATTG